jgi:predicted TIM-barrel fold metal-dependent hydrolase
LIDHHAHSVVADIPDRVSLERFLTESGQPPAPGCSYFDSFLGAAVLRTCAPVLELPASATADEYVARRLEMGGQEANRRLLRGAGVTELLVDDGFRTDELLDLDQLATLAAAPVRRVVRLEQLAEMVAGEGVTPARFAERFEARLADAFAGPDAAVASKSILAYRHGLDVDPAEPGPREVREAVREWLAGAAGAGPGKLRVSDPVLLRHLVWRGLRAGVPLQFHTGLGDTDLEIHRSNPALLTGLIRRAAPLGTPIMLLHCYP